MGWASWENRQRLEILNTLHVSDISHNLINNIKIILIWTLTPFRFLYLNVKAKETNCHTPCIEKVLHVYKLFSFSLSKPATVKQNKTNNKQTSNKQTSKKNCHIFPKPLLPLFLENTTAVQQSYCELLYGCYITLQP